MHWIREVIFCGTVALILLAVPAWGSEIEFGYKGTVTAVDAGFVASLPAGSGVEVGAPIWVTYSFESTTPDADPDGSLGSYPGTIQSWTLYVGDYTFTHDPGGSVNEISVLFEFAITIYESVDSVLATPPIPGQSSLESDVLFVGLSPLADDSLPLTQPDPQDPDWGQSDAGLFDGAGTTLIDIDLTEICSGTCAPDPNPQPVPMGGSGILALMLLSAGVYCSFSRRARGTGDLTPQ
jgi:hypothetical protein